MAIENIYIFDFLMLAVSIYFARRRLNLKKQVYCIGILLLIWVVLIIAKKIMAGMLSPEDIGIKGVIIIKFIDTFWLKYLLAPISFVYSIAPKS